MSSSAPQAAAPPIDRHTVITAFVLIAGGLAVIFDSTIVSIALDTLARELDVTVGTIQWVSTGYLLALGVAIPLVGWAQARVGGKRLWMIALAVFGLASIACSLAWDAPSLIAFRVVQGLGGGIMMPLMATLVIQQAGGAGDGLGRVMALVSLPTALGPILGPTIGGAILHSLSWPWLFWVNVPFCVVGLLLAWRFLPADGPTGRPRLDVVGLALLSPGLAGLLYGLSNVSKAGGFGRFDVWGPAGAGLLLVAAFVAWSVPRPERALVDVRLLGRRAVGSSATLFILSAASLYGAMLLLPLYFQNVRGMTALQAGVVLIPQGVGTLLSRVTAGRLTDTVGARWVAFVGFGVLGLATIPFAYADASTSQWWLMGVLLVRGVGLGAVVIPVMSVAFIGLDRGEVPHASIITRLAQQLGGAFGTAILAVILEANLARANDTAGVAAAFDTAFWWAVGFTVVAMALAFLLPAKPNAPAPVSPPPVPAVRS
ncbi:Drug resistance transporter, EmrB/QacA subfamily [Nostocoides japonicum T1-X7]|uniref:Drug resistance transporter, EmrB/QacA subfamily n=1 Tax=Nostocoides japonicum T1-X7 TaxID=1194083 RepID=A0A077LVX6_9MICO|nr:MDR family MFS transporter [Tetrasphaera japonica]CCH76095.1 Drug resistance transporter, EmrB/QacA subfamily [Tetrasphaera japonica T1-X7]